MEDWLTHRWRYRLTAAGKLVLQVEIATCDSCSWRDAVEKDLQDPFSKHHGYSPMAFTLPAIPNRG